MTKINKATYQPSLISLSQVIQKMISKRRKVLRMYKISLDLPIVVPGMFLIMFFLKPSQIKNGRNFF